MNFENYWYLENADGKIYSFQHHGSIAKFASEYEAIEYAKTHGLFGEYQVKMGVHEIR